MPTPLIDQTSYNTLQDITNRKQVLREAIKDDESRIQENGNSCLRLPPCSPITRPPQKDSQRTLQRMEIGGWIYIGMEALP